jgi:hypothetical protein
MAHHQLGQAQEARQWLDQAVQETAKAMKDLPQGVVERFRWHPHDWLTYHLLHREAEKLLKEAKLERVPVQ